MSADLRKPGSGQNILIAHYDLFKEVGGGQSVYKAIITARPNDTFYYFRRTERPEATRPTNAIAIPFHDVYLGTPDSLPSTVGHFFWVYVECRNMAACVASHCPGIAFDVLDVPDYSQAGLFLAHTLLAEGIRSGLTAVALHGTLSHAFQGGWPASGQARLLAELRLREHLQFRTADARYAISDLYARDWQHLIPLPINRLDPLCVIGSPTPRLAKRSAEAPDLAFVGRREKWKGPDLFLDFAWCIDPSLYRELIMIGPDGPNHNGISSMAYLPNISAMRRLKPRFAGNFSPDEMVRLYENRTVLLLPSRHDTFNLVALEAIFRGCPAHVSRRAGVATWLQRYLPQLSWLVTDIDCSRTAAGLITDTLRDYDGRRARLVETIILHSPNADMETAKGIYQQGGDIDIVARQSMIEMSARFSALVRMVGLSTVGIVVTQARRTARQAAIFVAPAIPAPIRRMRRQIRPLRRIQGMRGSVIVALKDRIKEASGFSPRVTSLIAASRGNEYYRREFLASNESRIADMRLRLRDLSRLVPRNIVNRVPLFLEMARLERRIGNSLTAAAYSLRVMRWLGRDEFGDVPYVAATLRKHGYPHEADAAEAMFGPREQAVPRCFDLVQNAYERNRRNPELPLAVLDDRRGNETRRVCVIASLYDAADKLPTLLAMLARQTVASRGELEVVLVDSNSPADEHGAMERFLADHSLPVAYARSAERETIQAAWNRGINLARAPYLCFLGADEGLHPDALCQLAAALDSNPAVDWAMADSVVTNVDRRGVYESDVMPYDRTGYSQDLVYLETCYLSWVGGLYRRSIHERFGYYDESFRAAGDTEFKNRILPHIRSVHVPNMLGVFNNYPEERTTASPRAEIEDLRAWYLWRTEGGLRYAFDQRPAGDAAALLRTALNYRKSFRGDLSSDFDIANALAGYLSGRPDAPSWVPEVRQELSETLALMRSIEWLPTNIPSRPRGYSTMAWVYNRVREVRRRGARHRELLNLPSVPDYELFNDNRHEQHWWSWSG